VRIRSLDQANQNTQNDSAMMKTAEGAVSSTVEILKSLKEKAINAANDSNTDEDRATIQKEMDQFIDQIDDNANVTFNGKYLVDGSKNSEGKATYTALTNQYLSTNTTGDTKITDLANRNNESLEIASTDKVTVSYVQNGETYSTVFQVGDKTLNDIFKEAEAIDGTTQTFATTKNDSVAAAKGTSAVSDSETVKQAVSYLRAALGSTNSDVVATDGKVTSTVSLTAATTDGVQTYTISTSGTDSKNVADSATGVATAVDGELYTQLNDALNAYNEASIAAGSYKRDTDGTIVASDTSGAAAALGKALQDAGVTWDGKIASLDTIDTSGVDASLVSNYKDLSAARDAAKEKLDEAINKYNDGIKQLDALVKLDNLNEKKEAYLTEVQAYVKGAKTQMNSDTSTANTYTMPVIKDGRGTRISENTEKLTYKVGTDVDGTTGNFKTDKINSIATALEDTLNGLLEVNGLTSPDLETNVGKVVNNASDGFNSGTNAIPAANLATTNLNNAAKAVDTAATALTTAVGDNKDIMASLQSAYDDVVSKFSGPALATGSGIGENASGKLVQTASRENAVTVTAAKAGIEGQIAGFSISISDAEGNVKKAANASLDQFKETIRAQNASADNALNFHVGAEANVAIKVGMTDMRSEALGLKGSDGTKLNIGTKEKANAAVNVLDNAIQKAIDQQTTIGAIEARLEYTSSNLTTSSENVQAAESTIRDADMAKEMTQYTKNNVLLQAAQSMLAQANQNSSAVLSLLQ